MSKELLDIVNENNEIIGSDTRANAHANGLLHREVNIWLFNDRGEVILERRSPYKDTCPNLLSMSSGGHVGYGQDYEETAIRELQEETGIKANPKDLIFIAKVRTNEHDVLTNMTNNAIQYVYAYKYNGKKQDLFIEQGEIVGFETVQIEKMLNLSEDEKKEFVPSITRDYYKPIFEKIKELINSTQV